MIAGGNVWDFGGVVIAAGITAAGLYFAARAGARRGATKGTEEGTDQVLGAMDPHNGGRSLGETVYGMSVLVERAEQQIAGVSAQGHEHAERLDEMHTAILEQREDVAQTREKLAEVHDAVEAGRAESLAALEAHVAEIAPLRGFVEHLMGQPKEGKGEGT